MNLQRDPHGKPRSATPKMIRAGASAKDGPPGAGCTAALDVERHIAALDD